jgi:Tol biopolymer transport system component
LRIINIDGSDESVIHDEEIFYTFLSVSNSGEIVFVADLTSKTADEYYSLNNNRNLYRISLDERTPAEIIPVQSDDLIVLPSWSPDEKHLAYRSYKGLKILNVETGEILELPTIEPSFENFSWSPNGQKIAATVSVWKDMAVDKEDHIYIFDIQNNTFHPLIQE